MNKKIVILVVIVECILAILLISVLGKAIESLYREVDCQRVNFTTADGEILEDGAVVQVDRPDRGYQLYYTLYPDNTTDKAVTFTSSKPDVVTVSETGYVNFDIDTDVVITISTKNGKTATVVLMPKPKTNGNVEL